MRDEKVAAFAERRGIPVHLLEQLYDDSWPRCHSKADTVLSTVDRVDVTCTACLAGLAPRLPCGRVDDHDDHPFSVPRRLKLGRILPRKHYWCPGTPVLEGGARG